MLSVALVTVLIPVVIAYFVINAYKKPKNFPPGPPSLPIYGAFPILRALGKRDLAKSCRKLSEIYNTKVLGFFLSIYPFVVVSGEALIREMLTRDEFDGRTDIFVARLRSYWKRLGIFFTDGYFWFVQRRFTLRQLREFGFGRRSACLEEVLDNEIREMIDMIANGPKYPAEKEIVKGDLVYLHMCFGMPFMNGLMHVMTQTTLPRSDYHLLWKMSENAMKFQMNTDDFGGAICLTPSLKDLAPNLSGYNKMREGSQYMLDFFKKYVEEALATYDESYDRHFLDSYIRKMKEEQRQSDKTTYSAEQLILTCVDYMLPSATGVEIMLSMLVERMLIQPEIQERVHEEIDRVVGRDRRPTLDDRINMPYTEACIREVMRHDTLVPMGIPHRAVKDTTIGGYDLAENTTILYF
ncbi:probable cytochrome P450 304a1 isoform X3 [Pectinophora gossypiella]|uniref:probable cytochrome P450 304a1 isoform X3 n=1 Tax=Pectinophora gossypiella TaxID=13191 RepID=UPI00214E24E6|nr:probable cytochrome P450 304a1 isoform X3 [Pectinophora gossypiella]